MFIYPIYNHNWRNISTIYIYITRLASNEIFSPSNKIYREVGRAKDLSATLYTGILSFKSWPINWLFWVILRCFASVSPKKVSTTGRYRRTVYTELTENVVKHPINKALTLFSLLPCQSFPPSSQSTYALHVAVSGRPWPVRCESVAAGYSFSTVRDWEEANLEAKHCSCILCGKP